MQFPPARPPRSGAFAPAPEQSTANRAEPVGDRYELHERLGSGGMGVIWRAHDTVLRRWVAYKTVPLDAPQAHRDRLIQEARIASRMAHDGVVTVFDQGVHPDGRPFYAMELLQFPAFTGDRSADLLTLTQIAHTLGAVHAAGIVHRDLKPSNIGKRHDRPILTDWGLAKPVQELAALEGVQATVAAPLTSTGMVVGTVGYLPPELITGGIASPQSDVWSLSAMLCEVLLGNRVESESASHKLLARLVAGDLPLGTTPIDLVCRKGLSVDPADRYASAAELAVALDQALKPPAPSAVRWWIPVSGLFAASLATVAALAWHTIELQNTADSARAAQGWMLYEQGERLVAATIARELTSSHPAAVGLRMAAHPRPAGLAPGFDDCESIRLDPLQQLALCQTSGSVSLRHLTGETLWTREGEGAWLRDGVATIHSGLQASALDAKGRLLRRIKSTPNQRFMATEELILTLQDRQLYLHHKEATRTAPEGSVQAFGSVQDGVVFSGLYDNVVAAVQPDGTVRTSETLAGPLQPPILVDVRGDTVHWVGMRGTYCRLRSDSLAVVNCTQLGPSQVDAAAVGTDEALAVSTPEGVFVYGDNVLLYQASEKSARSLSIHDDELWMAQGSALHKLPALTKAERHVGATPGITAAADWLEGEVFLGADDSTARLLNTHTMVTLPPYSLDKIRYIGSMGVRNRVLHVSTVGIYKTGRPSEMIEDSAKSFATLRNQTLLANRSALGGVVVVDDSGVTAYDGTDRFQRMERSWHGTHGLGVTSKGELHAVYESGNTEFIRAEVTVAVEGPNGLIWANGSTLATESWTFEADRPITRIAAAADGLIIAGNRGGEVLVLGPDGTLLAQLQAHSERISMLHIAEPYLLTGSWERGVKRWDLAQVR